MLMQHSLQAQNVWLKQILILMVHYKMCSLHDQKSQMVKKNTNFNGTLQNVQSAWSKDPNG